MQEEVWRRLGQVYVAGAEPHYSWHLLIYCSRSTEVLEIEENKREIRLVGTLNWTQWKSVYIHFGPVREGEKMSRDKNRRLHLDFSTSSFIGNVLQSKYVYDGCYIHSGIIYNINLINTEGKTLPQGQACQCYPGMIILPREALVGTCQHKLRRVD